MTSGTNSCYNESEHKVHTITPQISNKQNIFWIWMLLQIENYFITDHIIVTITHTDILGLD